MANENHIQEFLTDDQLHDLAIIILDQFGAGLPTAELEESISLVLEDVPGIEMESHQFFLSVIHQIKELYYGDSNKET